MATKKKPQKMEKGESQGARRASGFNNCPDATAPKLTPKKSGAIVEATAKIVPHTILWSSRFMAEVRYTYPAPRKTMPAKASSSGSHKARHSRAKAWGVT